MKRVKATQHGMHHAKSDSVLQSLLAAGLVLASVNAQASVTLAGNYGHSGSLVIHSPGIVIPPVFTYSNTPSASSGVSGNMNYSVGTSSGYFNESDSSSDGSMVELELNRKGYGYHAAATSQTGLAMARVETKSVAGSGNGYNYGSSSANATSTWSDWLVISGGTGEGTASFRSMLDGGLASGKNGSAGYSLNIDYTTGAYCDWWYNACSEADQNQTLFNQSSSLSGKGKSTLSEDVEGEFTFAYDKAFKLTVTLNVNAANGGMADFTLATLGDSLYLPAGASLFSVSGLPYAQAVPEAETYAMMLAGLGLVGWAARRRSTTSK